MNETNEEKIQYNEADSITSSSNLSNILIGVLLVVVAFLAFNFFQVEPQTNNTDEDVNTTSQPTQLVDGTNDTQTETETTIESTDSDKMVSSEGTYTVAAGDSLWKIAQRELNDGYLWTEIAALNKIDIKDADTITAGTEISLPVVAGAAAIDTNIKTSNQLYVVQKGDTLWRIADQFYNDGFMWEKIFDLSENNIELYTAKDGHQYPLLEEGDVLVVPEVPVSN